MVKRGVVPASKSFAQAMDTEEFLIGVRSFGDSITKEDECVAKFEFHTFGFVFGAGDKANRTATFRKGFREFSAAEKQWRRMPSIDVFEISSPSPKSYLH